MNAAAPGDEADGPAVAKARSELAALHAQAEAMRAVLVRLLQDVVVAESRLDSTQASQLIAANEALVLAALRNQADTDTATQALHDVARLAELDPLTQLPNRMLMLDRLTQAIGHAKRHSMPLALLFVDLNNFKQINDTLGHAVGDQVLQMAARAMVLAVRDADTVSRHGGDEFLILLTEVAQPADAVDVAHKVLASLAAPRRLGDHVLRQGASIGISIYPDDGPNAATLIDCADVAMYQAKQQSPHGGVARVRHKRADEPAPTRARLSRPQLTELHSSRAETQRRLADLQEANQKLLLSALDAQALQAAAQEAQAQQTEFLAVIAHELRNPLAPIRLATSMLGRMHNDEPLLPRAQAIIDTQLGQLVRLVDDLADGTRAAMGKLAITPQPVDLVDVLDQAVDATRPGMDVRLQSFHARVPLRSLWLNADPQRLLQVFCNLLNNASRYTPEGGSIQLVVEVVAASVVITVSDNGIGISAQTLPRVFEPFVQDAHAMGYNGTGLGVGLTVVRHLVAAHGGSVVARSEGVRLGSALVVTLPLRPDQTSDRAGPA